LLSLQICSSLNPFLGGQDTDVVGAGSSTQR
jgi:hypothetical protein